MNAPLTDDQYLIEDGIPIPRRGHNKGILDTLRKLQIGQSVLFPQYKRVGQLGNARRLLNGVKLTARVVEGGVRVWRTE